MIKKASSFSAAAIAAALLLLAVALKPFGVDTPPPQLPLLCAAVYLGSFMLSAWANCRPVTLLGGTIAMLSTLLLCASYPFLLPLFIPSVAAWFILPR